MTQKVIAFHYTLKNPEGNVLDSSEGAEPLAFLTDAGQIIPGLEKALLTMEEGQSDTIAVSAADAYGEYRDDLTASVPRANFPDEIEVGQQFAADPEGQTVVTVTSFTDEAVEIDANHPLAGVDLTFEVEITSTREATEEEKGHGHAHGADGTHTH